MNDGWYRVLWQRLTAGANKPQDFFSGNKVRFITYNYDRSLEQFLAKSYFGTYGVHYQEHGELPIFHVHGMAGGFNFLKSADGTRAYVPIDDFSQDGWVQAAHAAQKIQVMFENSDYNYIINNVVPWIEEAQRVFFLGCGYHRPNLYKLRYEYNQHISRHVIGTYFPPGRDRQTIQDRARNGFGLDIDLYGDNKSIIDLLHEYLPLEE